MNLHGGEVAGTIVAATCVGPLMLTGLHNTGLAMMIPMVAFELLEVWLVILLVIVSIMTIKLIAKFGKYFIRGMKNV